MCQLRHTWKTELVVRIEAVVVSGLLLDHALYQKLGDGIPTCRSLCLPRAGKTQCPDARCRQRFNRNRAGADSNLRLADLAGYVATRSMSCDYKGLPTSSHSGGLEAARLLILLEIADS